MGGGAGLINTAGRGAPGLRATVSPLRPYLPPCPAELGTHRVLGYSASRAPHCAHALLRALPPGTSACSTPSPALHPAMVPSRLGERPGSLAGLLWGLGPQATSTLGFISPAPLTAAHPSLRQSLSAAPLSHLGLSPLQFPGDSLGQAPHPLESPPSLLPSVLPQSSPSHSLFT